MQTHWSLTGSDENMAEVQTRIALIKKGCGCKTGCMTACCKCKKSGNHCGPGCACLSCCNVPASITQEVMEIELRQWTKRVTFLIQIWKTWMTSCAVCLVMTKALTWTVAMTVKLAVVMKATVRVPVKPGLWTGLDYGLDWNGLTKTVVYRQWTPPRLQQLSPALPQVDL